MERELLRYKKEIEQLEKDQQKLLGSLETVMESALSELGLDPKQKYDLDVLIEKIDQKIEELETQFRKTEIKFNKAMDKIKQIKNEQEQNPKED